MSAKKHNFKFCKKCKQEINFGEYKAHKRMGTKYHKNFLVSMDHNDKRIKIKYQNTHAWNFGLDERISRCGHTSF